MITLEDYFGRWLNHPDATPERKENARKFLAAVNTFLEFIENKVTLRENPNTECCVSGEQFGGFRPQCCTQGSQHSSHKEGRGLDMFDPKNEIDSFITSFDTPDGGNTLLERYGLYREHPDATHTWCHLTDRAPGSGRRSFYP